MCEYHTGCTACRLTCKFGRFAIDAPPAVALPQVASLMFGGQLYHSHHWINTQSERFHVGNNSMKEFMESIENDMIRLLYMFFSVHSHANQYYIDN